MATSGVNVRADYTVDPAPAHASDVDVDATRLAERIRTRTDRQLRRQALVAMGAFALISLLTLAAAPALLNYLFPILAFVLALLLFLRDKPAYVTFTLWLWFLTPFVRRLVDYRSGWHASSPVLLAPDLAALISVYTLLRNPRSLTRSSGAGFVCVLAAIFYGTIYGLTRYPVEAVAHSLVDWVVPIVFSFFLFHHSELYPRFRRSFEQAFLYGTFVMGAYGVYQFFLLPQWDVQWMESVGFSVFGVAAATSVRVFSTMNAPAPFATVMMSGLLLLLSARGSMRILAGALGFIALVFTISRASWLGFVFGAIFLALQLGKRERHRIIGGGLVAILLLTAAAQTPGIGENLNRRLKSFFDPAHDVSYNERVLGHITAFSKLADEPFGEGLGSTIVEHTTDGNDASLGPHDSTPLELLYGVGWPGTVVYLIGVALTFRSITSRRGKPGSFALGLRAVIVGYFAQIMLNSVLIGVDGFMLWACIGLSLSSGSTDLNTFRRERSPLLQIDARSKTASNLPGQPA